MTEPTKHYHVWEYADDTRGRKRALYRREGFNHRVQANRVLKRDYSGYGHVLRCNDQTCKLFRKGDNNEIEVLYSKDDKSVE